MFRDDAENEDVSIPLRIEAHFYAAFHLIEMIAVKKGVHIEKHQNVKKRLEENPEIAGSDAEQIWRAFQEIERNLRPGQVYGGQINGERLRIAKQLFETIETLCRRNLDYEP
jgi:uncharacterized protein (UPF0332 family)